VDSKPKKIILSLVLLGACTAYAQSLEEKYAPAPPKTLYDVAALLRGRAVIDLTHRSSSEMPAENHFADLSRETIARYKKHGFSAESFTFPGCLGTHAHSPAFFNSTLETLDELDFKNKVMPLVVLNIALQAEKNPDYVLGKESVFAWEAQYGKIPEGAFVVLRSDWHKRWPIQKFFDNRDEEGQMRTPGWGQEALAFLFNERKIAAIGQETFYTDPGILVSQKNFPAQTWLLAEKHFEIVALNRVNEVPAYGALVVVSFPKIKRSSSFPARVWAILP
jgi:kynurenine formamidase